MTERLLKFSSDANLDFDVVSEDKKPNYKNPWHVLVVDDDQAVHDVTRLILSDFHFNNRPMQLKFAYSAGEAKEFLVQANEFSVILLDVVMETDHAGLDLVTYIRNVLKNQLLRIILRTGQPGQAPELNLMVEYDINDYQAKTELTAEKMRSCMTSALQSFKDINTIR